MKAIITAVALGAATLGGLAVAPASADAQPRRWDGPRYWHGPAHGPRWHAWRRGYYGRWNRYPIRTCRHGRCWYR